MTDDEIQPTRPSVHELYVQAGGDTPTYSKERFQELLIEHGHLIPGKPEPLPCGYEPDPRAQSEGRHHQFGAIAGAADIGGVFALGDAVLLTEHTTLAVQSITGDQVLPVVVLELAGRVNKGQDTVQVAWLLSPLDAGQVAGALYAAVGRISTEACADFKAGLTLGAQEGNGGGDGQ